MPESIIRKPSPRASASEVLQPPGWPKPQGYANGIRARGDMVFVDAGTVHAIWPGSILLETQQNSDITYRLYDYGRPRELHVEKSLEAMRFTSRVAFCSESSSILRKRAARAV